MQRQKTGVPVAIIVDRGVSLRWPTRQCKQGASLVEPQIRTEMSEHDGCPASQAWREILGGDQVLSGHQERQEGICGWKTWACVVSTFLRSVLLHGVMHHPSAEARVHLLDNIVQTEDQLGFAQVQLQLSPSLSVDVRSNPQGVNTETFPHHRGSEIVHACQVVTRPETWD
ncbi:hypothetical protein RRG08_056837 [Elysia crispata]|uniref:Uncharacterized protein n=1 Tax=Elysia crispata TaxID=231223 RepID=A0AAE1AC54_9GAST|nr:hypothetical protein RRG08_056837 [Elysia crispata]